MEPVTHNTIRAGEVANMVNYLLKRTEKAPSVTNAEMQHALKTAVRTHVAHHPKAKEQPPARHKPIKMGGPGEAPTPDEIEAAKEPIAVAYRHALAFLLGYHPSNPKKDKLPTYLRDLVNGLKEMADSPDSTAGHNNVATAIGNMLAELKTLKTAPAVKLDKKDQKKTTLQELIAQADVARTLIPSKEETRQQKEAAKTTEAKKLVPIIVETDLMHMRAVIGNYIPIHSVAQAIIDAEKAYAQKPDPTHIDRLKATALAARNVVGENPDDPDLMVLEAMADEVDDILSPPTPPYDPAIIMQSAIDDWNANRKRVRKLELDALKWLEKLKPHTGMKYRRAVETVIALRTLTRDPDSGSAKVALHAAAMALAAEVEKGDPDKSFTDLIIKDADDATGPQ